MATTTIWLASNSPRRREMLAWSGWNLQKYIPDVDESRMAGELPEAYVSRIAHLKAETARQNLKIDKGIIIAADTTVALDKEILGKPANEEQARQMLMALRGKVHCVMTALSIIALNEAQWLLELCVSPVKLRNFSNLEMQDYINSGDPLDKAGAYAIQSRLFNPVEQFNGCMASVMGLPLCHLERALRKIAGYAWTDWPGICQKNLEYICPISHRVLAGEQTG